VDKISAIISIIFSSLFNPGSVHDPGLLFFHKPDNAFIRKIDPIKGLSNQDKVSAILADFKNP